VPAQRLDQALVRFDESDKRVEMRGRTAFGHRLDKALDCLMPGPLVVLGWWC